MVEVHDQKMLLPQVVDIGKEALKGIFGVLHLFRQCGFCGATAFAQLEGGHDGDGFGLTNAFVLLQIV